MKRTLTAAQQEAAEARKALFRRLANQIAKMSDAEREAMALRLPGVATIEGHPLSLANTCLVVLQFHTASVLGGFRQWIKAGRVVRKGEHGIMIWVPCSKRRSEAEAEDPGDEGDGERPRFIAGTVFDVSQTEELEAKVAA